MARKTWAQEFDERNADNSMFLIEMHKSMVFAALRARMHATGVSQKEIANRLDVSEAWVSKFLNREPDVRLSTLVKVAWALKCSWAEPALNSIPAKHEHVVLDANPWSDKAGSVGQSGGLMAIETPLEFRDWARLREEDHGATLERDREYRICSLELLDRTSSSARERDANQVRRSHHGKEEPANKFGSDKLATAA